MLGTFRAPLLRRLRTLLIASTVLLLAGAGGTPARAATNAEYLGVNLQPLMKDAGIAESRWNAFLTPLATGGLTVNRLDVNWKLAEAAAPVNGVHAYNWNAFPGTRDSIDYLMYAMASHGLRPSPTFTAPPSWAFGPATRLPDEQFQNFTDFVVAYAQRYGVNGAFWAEHPELPKLWPTEYEIWNEANSTNSWSGSPDAPSYARLLKLLYPQLKAAQPGSLVLASIGWPDFASYLDGLWVAGAGSSMDGIGFHPYAPTADAIIELAQKLRDKLGALGRGTMPIQITETGQPVAYSGPTPAHAYDGHVSDAARAATQSFAADALARSDCNVGQFLVYAVTGSETSKEIIGEGFMGVLRYADASPNVTGQALQRAALRWSQAVSSGSAFANGALMLCSGRPTADAALLPLELSLNRSGNTCVVGTVNYDGNPLEASALVLTTADGRKNTTAPDATGRSEVCIPNGPPVSFFDVHAEVAKAARSATYRCDVPVSRCSVIAAGPAAQGAKGAPGPTCTVSIATARPKKDRRGSRSRVKVRARLNCALVAKKAKAKFIVSTRSKRTGKERKVRSITLVNGKTVKFSIRTKIRKGDKLALLHKLPTTAKLKRTDKLPRLRLVVAFKTPQR